MKSQFEKWRKSKNYSCLYNPAPGEKFYNQNMKNAIEYTLDSDSRFHLLQSGDQGWLGKSAGTNKSNQKCMKFGRKKSQNAEKLKSITKAIDQAVALNQGKKAVSKSGEKGFKKGKFDQLDTIERSISRKRWLSVSMMQKRDRQRSESDRKAKFRLEILKKIVSFKVVKCAYSKIKSNA